MFSETSCSVLFSCKMRKFVTQQPCWDLLKKYQAPPTSRSTANRNALSLKWPVIGQSLPSQKRFFKAWKQSHREVQKCSYLSEHLNYNMLKDYYGVFAQWCQKPSAYWSFKLFMKQKSSLVAALRCNDLRFFFSVLHPCKTEYLYLRTVCGSQAVFQNILTYWTAKQIDWLIGKTITMWLTVN